MVVNARRSISEPRDAWEIFFTLDMLSHIVHKTNKKIENLRAEILLRGRNITSVPYTKNICSSEILVIICLLYLRGLLGLNNHDVAIFFINPTGNPVFGTTMSKNRFKCFPIFPLMILKQELRDGFMTDLPSLEMFSNHLITIAAVASFLEIFYLLMKLYIQ